MNLSHRPTPVVYPWDFRITLVVGKGGVGKTSVAASLANACAQFGHRTLLLELVDAASRGVSHLSQWYEKEAFEDVPSPLAEHLWGGHLWPATGHEIFLSRFMPSRMLVSAALRLGPLRAFMEAAPSLKEMGWYNHLLMLLQEKRGPTEYQFERVVIDMPATGHAVALAHLPDVLERLIPTGPVRSLLAQGRELLNDAKMTRAWAVTLPESLPVSETKELLSQLEPVFVYNGGVITNRCIDASLSEADQKILSSLLAAQSSGENSLDQPYLRGSVTGGRMLQTQEALAELDGWEMPILPLPEYAFSDGKKVVEAMSKHWVRLAGAAEKASG